MGSSSMQKSKEGNTPMNIEEMQEVGHKTGQGRLKILMVTCQEPLSREKNREIESERERLMEKKSMHIKEIINQ